MFDYVNVVYWCIALAGLIAWARFATFMCADISENLLEQPELAWKLGAAGVFLVMLIIFITVHPFWAAFPINAVLACGMIGAFWAVRVKTMGEEGHLFKKAIQTTRSVSKGMENKRNSRQVQLTYLRHDNSVMPLPAPSDPLAAGLGAADQIIIQAMMRRAETIELAPGKDGYMLSMVTDGVATQQPSLDRATAESAVQALKVLSGLSAEERRRPQQGIFRSRDAEGTATTWTVRTHGSVKGETAIIAANEKGKWDIGIEQLGFTAEQLAEVKKLGSDTKGLVIVTGPKGHGRTATLYALLRQHDAFTNSVQSLEVNPQTEIEGMTVNKFDGRGAGGVEASYSKTLQSIMLKDPNVLMVSQIADNATADLITRYALAESTETHRVYTALHAMDTFAALEMWMAMNSAKLDAVNALRAIIAERLVRILCPTCKIPYQPDESTMKRLNLPMGRNLQSFKANTEPIVDRKGHSITCPDCGGVGYKGRTGIFEVLIFTDELKKALASGSNVSQLKVLARKNNMMLLVEHGIRKFATGVTAIHEVTRVISPPAAGGSAAGKTSILPKQDGPKDGSADK